MGRLFGTDGVRGVANADLTGDLVYRLGRATVIALTEHGERRPKVTVGRDTRASGEFLEAALVAGICSAGGDAVLLGVCPTPGVAFLTTDLAVQAGVVISASHNPAEYNGIKIFAGTGFKLPDDVEDEIEALIVSGDGPLPTGRGLGRVRQQAGEGMERYLRHVESTAHGRLEGMRLVVDCANGAAHADAPELLRRLGAEVVPTHCHPNGWNINDGSGATAPEVMAAEVVRTGADGGVAFDGDADRAMFADHCGRIIDGDQVLAACSLDLRERDELEGNKVVATVMSNMGFRMAMQDAGVELVETKVGDRYVLEAMLATGAVLGGEQSGHLIFRRHATTGDGLLTAVQFLTLATRRGVTLERLAASMDRYPQELRNVETARTDALESAAAVWEAVRAAEEELGGSGRVLVRPSGTEPLVRVMVEAATEDEARRHADSIAEVVVAELAGSRVP